MQIYSICPLRTVTHRYCYVTKGVTKRALTKRIQTNQKTFGFKLDKFG